jgi:outer membrane immunogenic protein
MAADMAVKAPAPVASYYDWSGVYLGASIGGMWSTIDRQFPLPSGFGGFGPGPGGNFSTTKTDTIFDVHMGAQVQWGWLVLGAEAGYSACFTECTQYTGVLPVAPAGFPPLFTPGTIAQNKLTNLFTAGPRVGVAWDRFMIYGTGGYAAASLKGTYCVAATTVCGPSVTTQNGSSWNDGWFAGAGFEYMVYKGVLVDAILGGEYQHFDVSAKTSYPAATGAGYNMDAKGDIVRARLTIKTQGWRFIGP